MQEEMVEEDVDEEEEVKEETEINNLTCSK